MARFRGIPKRQHRAFDQIHRPLREARRHTPPRSWRHRRVGLLTRGRRVHLPGSLQWRSDTCCGCCRTPHSGWSAAEFHGIPGGPSLPERGWISCFRRPDGKRNLRHTCRYFNPFFSKLTAKRFNRPQYPVFRCCFSTTLGCIFWTRRCLDFAILQTGESGEPQENREVRWEGSGPRFRRGPATVTGDPPAASTGPKGFGKEPRGV